MQEKPHSTNDRCIGEPSPLAADTGRTGLRLIPRRVSDSQKYLPAQNASPSAICVLEAATLLDGPMVARPAPDSSPGRGEARRSVTRESAGRRQGRRPRRIRRHLLLPPGSVTRRAGRCEPASHRFCKFWKQEACSLPSSLQPSISIRDAFELENHKIFINFHLLMCTNKEPN